MQLSGGCETLNIEASILFKPIGLLLDLLEVRFVGLKELILEANSPNLFPVQLIYRGVEVTLKEKETRVVRPGGEEILYPRGEKAVIRF